MDEQRLSEIKARADAATAEDKYYVTCPYCTRTYLAVKKGGKLYVRKHYIEIPHSNNLGITIHPGEKMVCRGSHREAGEG
jgi:hypothetical protein